MPKIELNLSELRKLYKLKKKLSIKNVSSINNPKNNSLIYCLKLDTKYLKKLDKIRDSLIIINRDSKLPSLIKKFNSLDIWTLGLDMSGETEINKVDFKTHNYALFVGSEENGLSSEVQKKLDLIARINMENDIESLNVSVSAAVAMYQLFIKK